MSYMFHGTGIFANSFSIIGLEGWDTSNVIDMATMFNNTGASADWSVDLSGWDVSRVTNYTNFNKNVETKVIAPNWVN